MKFESVLRIVGNEPVFETGVLLAGDVDPAAVRSQLSSWVKTRRIRQLRRGLYALAEPYAKVTPHPFLIANRLAEPSYVSLQSALAYEGLIPEHVPVVTSITTRRPGLRSTPAGSFHYTHLKSERIFGFQSIEVSPNQFARIATPEKAIIDLWTVMPNSDKPEFIETLRLQNTESIDLDKMERLISEQPRRKLSRGFRCLRAWLEQHHNEYREL